MTIYDILDHIKFQVLVQPDTPDKGSVCISLFKIDDEYLKHHTNFDTIQKVILEVVTMNLLTHGNIQNIFYKYKYCDISECHENMKSEIEDAINKYLSKYNTTINNILLDCLRSELYRRD